MRLKQFLFVILVFTIVYFLFFAFCDFLKRKIEKRRQQKRYQSIMNEERFLKFAQFYGISKQLGKEQLESIYYGLHNLREYSLPVYAEKFQLEPLELAVVIKYFEYFHLFDAKAIDLKEEMVRDMNLGESGLAFKYGPFFVEKNDFPTIVQKVGDIALTDMQFIDSFYLFAGIRFVNQTIQYIEGVDIRA